ncbi:MAG: isoprenylcysteine carboxylmethyltransferase family protein [Candidatus Bathyarchaeota archaeon]|nr:isoprenylcysteine carboxylmethyltransferase family protein [Candidatus Bathyarchaeota archaeon]
MMMYRKHLGSEYPNWDSIQIILALAFFVFWSIDSFIFKFTTFLAEFIPLYVRLIFAVFVLGMSFYLMVVSHQMIFGKISKSHTILNKGVYAIVRHPMYLGTVLFYLGFVLATISLLSLVIWILIFFIYDRATAYEEDDLIRIFDDKYLKYKKQVSKWFPRMLYSKN